MSRIYLWTMIAVMVAVLFSRIRFLREAFEPTRVPAAVEASGPGSVSGPARETGVETSHAASRPGPEGKLEPEEVPIRPAED